jgi:hypothetical protein
MPRPGGVGRSRKTFRTLHFENRLSLLGTKKMEDRWLAAFLKKTPTKDGTLDIVSHGWDDFIKPGDGGTLIARELAEMIKRSPQFDAGKSIRLLSCHTGRSGSGFAQDLANKLGVPVSAPSDRLWVHSTGSMTIGPTLRENTGKWVRFVPGGNK